LLPTAERNINQRSKRSNSVLLFLQIKTLFWIIFR
jgi:hypothetical protein